MNFTLKDLTNSIITLTRTLMSKAAEIDYSPAIKTSEKILAYLKVKSAKLLMLKDRYLYTKQGHMRLRYLVLPIALILVGVPMLATSVMALHSNAPVYDKTSNDQEGIAGMLDGSLYGQLSLVSAMTRSALRPTDKIVTVEPGDALGAIMEEAGIGHSEANKVVESMKETFDPRDLKAGQDVHMHFTPSETQEGNLEFARLKIPLSPIKTVVVEKDEEGYATSLDEKEVKRVVRAERAQIEVSLYGSAAKAGIPVPVVANAIRIYSWNVDFQRDIRQGDTIEIMYESFETEDGHVAETGNILYANLTLNDKPIPLYRFDMQDGRTDYFGPNGLSIKRTLMKTPIDGARMSSGYGMRRHPILGYNKMHKGVDFAAPTGTPIYAAGDGVVEKVGWVSGYGKYIRIRHNSSLKTAYAHMSKNKVKTGQRVKQGEVIAYVGSTGRSTGPHLHYEVHLNGRQVNPRSVNLPTGEELQGADMKKFKSHMRSIDQRYASLTQGQKFALNFLRDKKERDVN